MELSIPASPSRLAELRRAARVYLHGVSDEVPDDVVLALNDAATNAVLYGSSGDRPIQVAVHFGTTFLRMAAAMAAAMAATRRRRRPEPPGRWRRGVGTV